MPNPPIQIPVDNRAVGTGNPPIDFDNLDDAVAQLYINVAQLLGSFGNAIIPGSNAANVATLVAQTGVNVSAVLSTDPVQRTLYV